MTDFVDLARKTLGELADVDSVQALSLQFTLIDIKAREYAHEVSEGWRKKHMDAVLERDARAKKLTREQVHSIAARLLDDMFANLMPHSLQRYDEHDVKAVALSLGEMLADECLVEEP